MEKPGVLFLCTANSARSVMAEAFFRTAAGDAFEVASAGLEPRSLNPLTVRVMSEVGIDVSGHTPHAVKDFLGKRSFRYVVTVCKEAEAACPVVWPFASFQHSWPFEDPVGGEGTEEERLDRFRTTRDAIQSKVLRLAEELKAELRARGVR